MKNKIHGSFDRYKLGNIVADKAKPLVCSEVIKVSLVSRQQVIDGNDLMTLLQEAVGQVGPKEACSSRNHANWHGTTLRFISWKSKP
jgi:hypothetical protein